MWAPLVPVAFMSLTVFKRKCGAIYSLNNGFVPFVVADDGLTMNATPVTTNATATHRIENSFTPARSCLHQPTQILQS